MLPSTYSCWWGRLQCYHQHSYWWWRLQCYHQHSYWWWRFQCYHQLIVVVGGDFNATISIQLLLVETSMLSSTYSYCWRLQCYHQHTVVVGDFKCYHQHSYWWWRLQCYHQLIVFVGGDFNATISIQLLLVETSMLSSTYSYCWRLQCYHQHTVVVEGFKCYHQHSYCWRLQCYHQHTVIVGDFNATINIQMLVETSMLSSTSISVAFSVSTYSCVGLLKRQVR